ncbi:family 16 glycosylhydrolase [Shewanella waksmanii]|uniref:glycoside hydrolase family 16 protein n=1 Tax=Shewanella waksmanii TaxID=213783 RepID=UPI0037366649
MKKCCQIMSFAALLLMVGCGSDSASEPQAQTATSAANSSLDTPQWQLVWSDEFDASEIDESKWSFEVNCFGGGNQEQQCYTARKDNAYISQGKLVITAKAESYSGPAMQDDSPEYDANDTSRPQAYTSARLRTVDKGDWTYGRFEIRAKLPKGQGTWPAIWMLPSDWEYGGWAASGEIDIMEAVNLGTASDRANAPLNERETRVHGTLHYGRPWPENVYSGSAYRLPNDVSPADDFHTYAIEWQQGEIRWYVDDVHYATQTQSDWYSQQQVNGQWVTAHSSAPFDQPFHLILNLAVGGNWPSQVNEKGVDASVFPQSLVIDYVRVYECSIAPNTGEGCAI